MSSDAESLKRALADSGVSEALEAWRRDRIALSTVLADVAKIGRSDDLSAAIRNLGAISDEHRRLALGITALFDAPGVTGLGGHLAADLPSISRLASELVLGTGQLRLMGQIPDTAAIGRALDPALYSLVSDLGRVGFTEHWQGYLRSFIDIPDATGFADAIRAASGTASVNFSSVDYSALFGIVGDDATTYGLLTATAGYARRTAQFAQSVDQENIEPELRSLPHDGLAAHSASLRELTDDEYEIEVATEDEAFLLEHLSKLDPELLTNYRGMKAAERKREIDWCSHAAISGRKLVEGVINQIAPHCVVVPWSQANKHELLSTTQATRVAQIHWVCSNISNAQYALVLLAELEAGLKVMRSFNAAVHSNGNARLKQRFGLVIRDAEQLIRHLLTVWLIRG